MDVCRGTLCAVARHNLASHDIGVLREIFSKSTYICSFCTVDQVNFLSCHFTAGETRTIESYKDSVLHIDVSTSDLSLGIKSDSKFNDNESSHICKTGLPPCLGYDLFEGVVTYDLVLYINDFVTNQNLFTYKELNRRLNHFKSLGSDASNKPSEVNSGSEKLSGHALQNLC